MGDTPGFITATRAICPFVKPSGPAVCGTTPWPSALVWNSKSAAATEAARTTATPHTFRTGLLLSERTIRFITSPAFLGVVTAKQNLCGQAHPRKGKEQCLAFPTHHLFEPIPVRPRSIARMQPRGMGGVTLLLAVQVGTFLALGLHFLAAGDWRLGTAQLLLAAVQAVVYSGRMAS